MKGSLFVFPTDLIDEGFDRVLNNARERGGLDAITLACNYHHSRDLFPHNPVRKVYFYQGGVYFHPDQSMYTGLSLQPDVSPLVQDVDPLARAISTASAQGMAVRAWTNNMHTTSLGSAHPECVVENVFGDRYITCLCPANPDVRAYTVALSTDLAQHDIESLVLESVNYMPFEHGYHHERVLIPLSDVARYLLGLCFCAHCRQAGQRAGVDADALRAEMRSELQRNLDGEPSALDELPMDREQLSALAHGELGQYLAARQNVVTSLVQAVAEAVHAIRPLPIDYMEWSGAFRSADTGMPVRREPAPAVARTWQDGVDLPAILRHVDGVEMLGYVRDVTTLRRDATGYRTIVPREKRLSVALRPMPPDCNSSEDLLQKVEAVQDLDLEWLDFYHYAMMRLPYLDWVGGSRRAVRVGGR